MLKLSTKSKLKQEEVIKSAVQFFGPGGYGLDVIEETADSAVFEGGGGGVGVSTAVEGDKTTVDIVSREWDYQVKEFIGKL